MPIHIVLFGHSLDSKCDVANMLVKEPGRFRSLICRGSKPHSHPITDLTIGGQPLMCVVTPNLNSPGWRHCVLDFIKYYEIMVIVYVKMLSLSSVDDTASIKRIQKHLPNCPIVIMEYNTLYTNRCTEHISIDATWPFERKCEIVHGLFEEINSLFNVTNPEPNEPKNKPVQQDESVTFKSSQRKPKQTGLTIAAFSEQEYSKVKVIRTETPLPTKLTEKDWRSFAKTLHDGKASSNHIRVNVVGCQGVGKTTLVRRLQRMSIKCPDEHPDPTEALDIDEITSRYIQTHNGHSWETRYGEGFVNELSYTRMAEAMIPEVESEASSYDLFSDVIREEDEIPASKKQNEMSVKNRQPQNLESTYYQNELKNKQKGDFLKEVIRYQNHPKLTSVYVSFWDFAGQSTYYSTHQAFLSNRAVYLVVLDLSKGLDARLDDSLKFHTGNLKDCSVKESLLFWFASIKAYTRDSRGARAPFMIVGTHGDKVNDEESDAQFAQVKQLANIADIECIKINNTIQVKDLDDDPEDLRELRQKVIELGLGIVHDETVPANWIVLEHELNQKKEEGAKVITYKELQDLNKEMDVPLQNTETIHSFLEHLHCRGQVMFFPVKDLHDLIILKPTILAKFLNALMRVSEEPKRPAVIDLVNQDGFISTQYIEKAAKQVLTQEEIAKTNLIQLLTKMLTHLHIIVPFMTKKKELDVYMMPCLLPMTKQTEEQKGDTCKVFPPLRITFTDSHMPLGFYHLFIAALIATISDLNIAYVGKKPQLFNLHACLYLKKQTVLCNVYWMESTILIELKNYSTKLSFKDIDTRKFVHNVNAVVQNTLNKYRHSDVDWALEVACPVHKQYFVSLADLCEQTEAMCHSKDNDHAINLEEVFPEDYSDMMEKVDPSTNIEISDKHLARLGNYLTVETPHTLATLLKMPNPQRESSTALQQYQEGNRARLYILKEWKKHTANRPLGFLFKRLASLGSHELETLKNVVFAEGTVMNKTFDVPPKTLDRQLEDKDMANKFIGGQYTFLMLELGLSLTNIEIKERDHRGDVLETVKELLHMWIREDPPTATIRKLMNTMSFLNMETKEFEKFLTYP